MLMTVHLALLLNKGYCNIFNPRQVLAKFLFVFFIKDLHYFGVSYKVESKSEPKISLRVSKKTKQ